MARAPKAKFPWQPVILDHGVHRFEANAICKWLVDIGRVSLNEIAMQGFSRVDQAQFAQLIGYSASGWGDLSYVTRDEAEMAMRKRPVKRPRRRSK